MTQDQSDPVIDEIRGVRNRISARFEHDPARLVAYYIKLQEQHRDRLVNPPKVAEPTDQSCLNSRRLYFWQSRAESPVRTSFVLVRFAVNGSSPNLWRDSACSLCL